MSNNILRLKRVVIVGISDFNEVILVLVEKSFKDLRINIRNMMRLTKISWR